MKNTQRMIFFVCGMLIALLLGIGVGTIPVKAFSSRQKVNLTAEEKEYIQSVGAVKVAISPDNYPYTTYQEGIIGGVFSEYLSLISYETGLQFEILPCKTYEEYATYKKNKTGEIILGTYVSEAEAEQAGYRLTKKFIDIPYSKIESKQKSSSTGRVAVLKGPSPEEFEARKYYYDDQIVECDSREDCMKALDNGECEDVILNSFYAEYIQYNDIKNEYVVKELYDNTVSIAAGIRLDADPLLYSIIDKSLQSVDSTTQQEIVSRNSQQREKELSLVATMYSNPTLFIGLFGALFVLLALVLFLIYWLKRNSMEKHQDEDYKRFMGYICSAMDAVTELDVKKRTMTRYTMHEGQLVVQNEPYPENEWVMFHEDEREKVKEQFSDENILAICQSGYATYTENRMRWNNSMDYRWCNCILQGIHPTKEKPMSVLLMIKDTQIMKSNEETQRKALEDAFMMAKQASEAKGTFLSKMSHEIRTPLNAVIGYLSIAKDSDNSMDKIMHCVDNSEVAAKHLLSIINDVLDISSIESGKMKIAHVDFDLKKAIMDLTTIFFQTSKTKGVQFEANIDNLTEEWVMGDPMRLNQILMNLLSNAVKFTPEDGIVRLKIEQLGKDEQQVYIRFTVNDSGIGMSEEYKERLFTPFEQESASTAQHYGGTGLGLSITYNLISMMGGKIDVISELGKGSTFNVSLPFAHSTAHPVTEIKNVDYSHVRALIVDDEKDEGRQVRQMLKRCGVKSDAVTSGALAIKRLISRAETDYAYNLCILDWSMPEMNGLDTAKAIREHFDEDIPIIIATAYDTAEIEDEAKAIGVRSVVPKPLFQSTLFNLLVNTFGDYTPQAGQSEDKGRMDMHGVHVLLAEDNPMNMEIAVTVLEKVGIVVDQAINGQIACDKMLNASPGTYDLILMDVQMPVMGGYKATQTIRNSNHPEAKTIPIIAMTANAFAEDVNEALANGMDAHIAKPINYDKLFEVLNHFANRMVGGSQ